MSSNISSTHTLVADRDAEDDDGLDVRARMGFLDHLDELRRRLLYSIIFHLIDYRGKITDYGTPGFPTRDYPFEPVPDEPKS